MFRHSKDRLIWHLSASCNTHTHTHKLKLKQAALKHPGESEKSTERRKSSDRKSRESSVGEKSGVQLLTPLHPVAEEQDSKERAQLVHTCSLTLVEQSDWLAIKVPVQLASTSARKLSLLLFFTFQHLARSAVLQSSFGTFGSLVVTFPTSVTSLYI